MSSNSKRLLPQLPVSKSPSFPPTYSDLFESGTASFAPFFCFPNSSATSPFFRPRADILAAICGNRMPGGKPASKTHAIKIILQSTSASLPREHPNRKPRKTHTPSSAINDASSCMMEFAHPPAISAILSPMSAITVPQARHKQHRSTHR